MIDHEHQLGQLVTIVTNNEAMGETTDCGSSMSDLMEWFHSVDLLDCDGTNRGCGKGKIIICVSGHLIQVKLAEHNDLRAILVFCCPGSAEHWKVDSEITMLERMFHAPDTDEVQSSPEVPPN